MGIVGYFILTVVKKNSLKSVLSKVKQHRERNKIFNQKKNEVKKSRELSQRFLFNNRESQTA